MMLIMVSMKTTILMMMVVVVIMMMMMMMMMIVMLKKILIMMYTMTAMRTMIVLTIMAYFVRQAQTEISGSDKELITMRKFLAELKQCVVSCMRQITQAIVFCETA